MNYIAVDGSSTWHSLKVWYECVALSSGTNNLHIFIRVCSFSKPPCLNGKIILHTKTYQKYVLN